MVVGREEKMSDREFNRVIEKENERKRGEETRERTIEKQASENEKEIEGENK